MLPDLLQEMGFETSGDAAHKPLLGVSACLLGRPVRYDGGHRDNGRLRETLSGLLRFTEVCPEVAIGLPVPRPPIQVVTVGEERRVRGVHDPRRDYTGALAAQARRMDEPLNGFVFKARSPSCGLGTTPVHDARGQPRGLANGAYAAALTARFPHLPVCNESDLESALFLNAFTVRLFCHHRWRHDPDPVQSLDGLHRRSACLDEPLRANVRRFLDSLADADPVASDQQRDADRGNHAEQ